MTEVTCRKRQARRIENWPQTNHRKVFAELRRQTWCESDGKPLQEFKKSSNLSNSPNFIRKIKLDRCAFKLIGSDAVKCPKPIETRLSHAWHFQTIKLILSFLKQMPSWASSCAGSSAGRWGAVMQRWHKVLLEKPEGFQGLGLHNRFFPISCPGAQAVQDLYWLFSQRNLMHLRELPSSTLSKAF